MKKFFNLILASSVALGFAACNNDKAHNEPANEGATMLRLTVSEAQTRAQSEQDADGVGAESKVANGLFMTVSADRALSTALSTSFAPSGNGVEKGWESEVVNYTGQTGSQKATLVLNYPQGAGRITDTDQTISLTDLEKLTLPAGFTMSAKTTKDVDIKPTINNVIDVQDENSNLFSFEVERVVSKVQFSLPGDNVNLNSDLSDKGAVSDLRYAVAGSADKVYLFRDHAGERTMGADKKYDGFKSAIHNNIPAVGDTKRVGVTRLSAHKLQAKYELDDKNLWDTMQSLKLVKSDNDKLSEEGIYFLENSLDKKINGKGQLNYNDITYVKVYAKFAPKGDAVRKYDPSTKEWSEVAAYSGVDTNDYEVVVNDDYYNANHQGVLADRFRDADGVHYFTIKDAPGTFYVGENGKLYYDLISARADNNPTAKKYVGGKMVWMTPANNQMDDTNSYTMYADTRRNNIYSLSLTEIEAIGENYDPVDPEDPNVPKPGDNPDEPKIDPIKPVDPAEIYIQVRATILKWNLVHRGVTLK